MPSPSVSTFTFPSTTEPVFSASTSEPVFESPNHSQTSQTTQSQGTANNLNNHYSNNMLNFLIKEGGKEYETFGPIDGVWILNSDHNLWNIVLNGNSRKRTGRDPKGNIMILPPVSVEEQIAVQRETKASTIWPSSLLRIIMEIFPILMMQGIFGLAVTKSDLEVLSRALPLLCHEWPITIKQRVGLDYLSLDDMYNMLLDLEIDGEGLALSYDSKKGTCSYLSRLY
ncbi:hypothetical protein Tco_0434576 [Tanacetum coccineum]